MKIDLALNNLQWLICHKTKPSQAPSRTILFIYRLKPIRRRETHFPLTYGLNSTTIVLLQGYFGH